MSLSAYFDKCAQENGVYIIEAIIPMYLPAREILKNAVIK